MDEKLRALYQSLMADEGTSAYLGGLSEDDFVSSAQDPATFRRFAAGLKENVPNYFSSDQELDEYVQHFTAAPKKQPQKAQAAPAAPKAEPSRQQAPDPRLGAFAVPEPGQREQQQAAVSAFTPWNAPQTDQYVKPVPKPAARVPEFQPLDAGPKEVDVRIDEVYKEAQEQADKREKEIRDAAAAAAQASTAPAIGYLPAGVSGFQLREASQREILDPVALAQEKEDIIRESVVTSLDAGKVSLAEMDLDKLAHPFDPKGRQEAAERADYLKTRQDRLSPLQDQNGNQYWNLKDLWGASGNSASIVWESPGSLEKALSRKLTPQQISDLNPGNAKYILGFEATQQQIRKLKFAAYGAEFEAGEQAFKDLGRAQEVLYEYGQRKGYQALASQLTEIDRQLKPIVEQLNALAEQAGNRAENLTPEMQQQLQGLMQQYEPLVKERDALQGNMTPEQKQDFDTWMQRFAESGAREEELKQAYPGFTKVREFERLLTEIEDARVREMSDWGAGAYRGLKALAEVPAKIGQIGRMVPTVAAAFGNDAARQSLAFYGSMPGQGVERVDDTRASRSITEKSFETMYDTGFGEEPIQVAFDKYGKVSAVYDGDGFAMPMTEQMYADIVKKAKEGEWDKQARMHWNGAAIGNAVANSGIDLAIMMALTRGLGSGATAVKGAGFTGSAVGSRLIASGAVPFQYYARMAEQAVADGVGIDEAQAAAIGGVALEMTLEGMFPSYAKWSGITSYKDARNALRRLVAEGNPDLMNKLVRGNIRGVLEDIPLEGVEELGAEVFQSVVNAAVNALTGEDLDTEAATLPDMVVATALGITLTAFPAAVRAATIGRDVKSEAAVTRAFYSALENGHMIDQVAQEIGMDDQYRQLLSRVNELAGEIVRKKPDGVDPVKVINAARVVANVEASQPDAQPGTRQYDDYVTRLSTANQLLADAKEPKKPEEASAPSPVNMEFQDLAPDQFQSLVTGDRLQYTNSEGQVVAAKVVGKGTLGQVQVEDANGQEFTLLPDAQIQVQVMRPIAAVAAPVQPAITSEQPAITSEQPAVQPPVQPAEGATGVATGGAAGEAVQAAKPIAEVMVGDEIIVNNRPVTVQATTAQDDGSVAITYQPADSPNPRVTVIPAGTEVQFASDLRAEPTPTDEVVPNEEFEAFVDSGQVAPERIQAIAQKIRSQAPLTPREEAIRAEKAAEVEAVLQPAQAAPAQRRAALSADFDAAGQQAESAQSGEPIADFLLENAEAGDTITLPSGEGFEVTEVNTRKDGTKEVVLVPFTVEDGVRDYSYPGTRTITSTKKKGAGDLYSTAYTNAAGERVVENYSYTPNQANDTQNQQGLPGQEQEGRREAPQAGRGTQASQAQEVSPDEALKRGAVVRMREDLVSVLKDIRTNSPENLVSLARGMKLLAPDAPNTMTDTEIEAMADIFMALRERDTVSPEGQNFWDSAIVGLVAMTSAPMSWTGLLQTVGVPIADFWDAFDRIEPGTTVEQVMEWWGYDPKSMDAKHESVMRWEAQQAIKRGYLPKRVAVDSSMSAKDIRQMDGAPKTKSGISRAKKRGYFVPYYRSRILFATETMQEQFQAGLDPQAKDAFRKAMRTVVTKFLGLQGREKAITGDLEVEIEGILDAAETRMIEVVGVLRAVGTDLKDLNVMRQVMGAFARNAVIDHLRNKRREIAASKGFPEGDMRRVNKAWGKLTKAELKEIEDSIPADTRNRATAVRNATSAAQIKKRQAKRAQAAQMVQEEFEAGRLRTVQLIEEITAAGKAAKEAENAIGVESPAAKVYKIEDSYSMAAEGGASDFSYGTAEEANQQIVAAAKSVLSPADYKEWATLDQKFAKFREGSGFPLTDAEKDRLDELEDKIGKELQDRGDTDMLFQLRPEEIAAFEAMMDATEAQLERMRLAAALGGVQFLASNQALITLFTGANITTLIHEFAHVARRFMQYLAANGDPVAAKDYDTLAKWAGAAKEESGAWTWDRAAEERMAEGTERYFMTGKAPTRALLPVFQQLRQWFRAAYDAIAPRTELTPEVEAALQRMFGRPGSTNAAPRNKSEFMAAIRELRKGFNLPRGKWVTREQEEALAALYERQVQIISERYGMSRDAAWQWLQGEITANLDEAGTDALYSVLGYSGMSGLVADTLKQSRGNDFLRAWDMYNSEIDTDTIRAATGWMRGVDGLWRYEPLPADQPGGTRESREEILRDLGIDTERLAPGNLYTLREWIAEAYRDDVFKDTHAQVVNMLEGVRAEIASSREWYDKLPAGEAKASARNRLLKLAQTESWLTNVEAQGNRALAASTQKSKDFATEAFYAMLAGQVEAALDASRKWADTVSQGREALDDSALSQQDRFNRMIDRVLYGATRVESVMGEVGSFRLRQAEGATEAATNLARARAMEQAGETPERIRLATSWARGADGRWEFENVPTGMVLKARDAAPPQGAYIDGEIRKAFGGRYPKWEELSPDDQALFDQTYERARDEHAKMVGTMGQPTKLSELIDYPALFEAFPEMADMEVAYDPNFMGATYYMERSGPNGPVATIAFGLTASDDLNRSAMLYSLEKAVQRKLGLAGPILAEPYLMQATQQLLGDPGKLSEIPMALWADLYERAERLSREAPAGTNDRSLGIRSILPEDHRRFVLRELTDDVSPQDLVNIEAAILPDFQVKNLGDALMQQERGTVRGAAFTRGDRKGQTAYTKDANVMTFIHEPAHHFYDLVEHMAAAGNEAAMEDMAAIEAYVRSDAGRKYWARQRQLKRPWATGKYDPTNYTFRQELWAQATEKYLSQGGEGFDAPFAKVLDKFKNWAMELWKGLFGYPTEVELTQDIRKLFDRLYGKQTVDTNVAAHNEAVRAGTADTAPAVLEVQPKNFYDMVNAMQTIFGLPIVEARAAAAVMDRIMGTMAERSGVTKDEIYKKLKFEKATIEQLPEGARLQDVVFAATRAFTNNEEFNQTVVAASVVMPAGVHISYPYATGFETAPAEFLIAGLPASDYLTFFEQHATDLGFAPGSQEYADVVSAVRAAAAGTLDKYRATTSRGAAFVAQTLNESITPAPPKVRQVLLESDGVYPSWDTEIDQPALKRVMDQAVIDGKLTQAQATEIRKGEWTYQSLYQRLSELMLPTEASALFPRAGIHGVRTAIDGQVAYVAFSGDAIPLGDYTVRAQANQAAFDYWMEHRPPAPDFGAPLHALDTGDAAYPSDIYGPNAVQFYGTGDAAVDRESIEVMRAVRGKPDADVKIYRAVPAGTDGKINPGDWVTLSPTYARQHAEGFDDFEILEATVPASSLYTNADSLGEFGYWPDRKSATNNIGTFDPNDPNILRQGQLGANGQAQAAIKLSKDGTAIIYALTNPNVSSPLHEIAHMYEDYLTPQEKRAVLHAAGVDIPADVPDADLKAYWSTAVSEFFARGFERYLYDGQPTSNDPLTKIFAQIAEWLKATYVDLLRSEIAVPLSPKMRAVYDQMLGAQPIDLSTLDAKEKQFDALMDKVFPREARAMRTAQLAELSDRGKKLYQLVGENAQLAANIRQNLRIAQMLERELGAQGEDAMTVADTIWEMTGWERGTDGKWRYEIPDVELAIPLGEIQKMLEAEQVYQDEKTGYIYSTPAEGRTLGIDYYQSRGVLTPGVTMPLSQLVGKDSPLLKAYPKMADRPVTIYDTGRWLGTYQPMGDILTIDAQLLDNPNRLRSVLVHELQHAVQAREGFGSGTTGVSMSDVSYAEKERGRILDKRGIALQIIKDGNDTWIRENWERLDDADRAAYQAIADYAESARMPLVDAAKVRDRGWKRDQENQQAIIDQEDIYTRTSGEVEARNVQERLTMPPARRRALRPAVTEDVARDEQIVVFEGPTVANQAAIDQANNQFANMVATQKFPTQTTQDAPRLDRHRRAVEVSQAAKWLDNVYRLLERSATAGTVSTLDEDLLGTMVTERFATDEILDALTTMDMDSGESIRATMDWMEKQYPGLAPTTADIPRIFATQFPWFNEELARINAGGAYQTHAFRYASQQAAPKLSELHQKSAHLLRGLHEDLQRPESRQAGFTRDTVTGLELYAIREVARSLGIPVSPDSDAAAEAVLGPGPRPFQPGAESEVFLSADGRTVAKAVRPYLSTSILEALDRFEAHSALFPATAYTLTGVTLEQLVVTQRHVAGREPTKTEIRQKLEEKGYTYYGPNAVPPGGVDTAGVDSTNQPSAAYRHPSGMVISDVEPRNARMVETAPGVWDLVIFDPYISWPDEILQSEPGLLYQDPTISDRGFSDRDATLAATSDAESLQEAEDMFYLVPTHFQALGITIDDVRAAWNAKHAPDGGQRAAVQDPDLRNEPTSEGMPAPDPATPKAERRLGEEYRERVPKHLKETEEALYKLVQEFEPFTQEEPSVRESMLRHEAHYGSQLAGGDYYYNPMRIAATQVRAEMLLNQIQGGLGKYSSNWLFGLLNSGQIRQDTAMALVQAWLAQRAGAGDKRTVAQLQRLDRDLSSTASRIMNLARWQNIVIDGDEFNKVVGGLLPREAFSTVAAMEKTLATLDALVDPAGKPYVTEGDSEAFENGGGDSSATRAEMVVDEIADDLAAAPVEEGMAAEAAKLKTPAAEKADDKPSEKPMSKKKPAEPKQRKGANLKNRMSEFESKRKLAFEKLRISSETAESGEMNLTQIARDIRDQIEKASKKC